MVVYGQLVIGPPGSGKTTYCNGVKQLLISLGRRVILVNLDPANEFLPYKPDIDIADLITLDDSMKQLGLGPNGGLIYCMEFLEKNLAWLTDRLAEFQDDRIYVLFDCPGQVELYTHHQSISVLARHLENSDFRLVAVHLVDSHYCSDPAKFISVLLTSLSTMLQLALPHVNVLSKMDLIQQYGKLAFSLDYFTDVLDLSYLCGVLGKDPLLAKYRKLNEHICGLVEDYSLVAFSPLCVEDKESMLNVIRVIDKANGYCFGGLEKVGDSVFGTLSSNMGVDFEYGRIGLVEELYTKKNPDDQMLGDLL